jgi:hypothetical protein
MNTPTYYLSIRYWFDKVNGNTYHTARIMGPDTDIIMPFDYGHGTRNVEYAAAKLLGIDLDTFDHDSRRALFITEETTVTRKKDLHKKG